MKILPANISQTKLKTNQYSAKPVLLSQNDTFVKSTPSFKGGEQKILLQGNKTLLELSAFLTAGFVAFKTLTGDSEDLKNANIDTENNPFKDFFNNLFGKKDEKVKQLEEENEKLRQENESLKTAIEQNKSDKKNVTSEKENPKAKEEQTQHVLFPPKRGILSAEQKTLKLVVTSINISPEYNEKLTNICKDLLQKGSKDTANREATLNLASELKNCNGDIEKLKAVVDKYEIKDKSSEDTTLKPTGKEDSNDTVQEDTTPKPTEKEDSNSTEIFKPVSDVKLQGVKPVGKIDLSSIKDGRKKRPRIKNNDTNSSKGAKTDKKTAAGTSKAKSAQIPKEVYEYSVPAGAVAKETRQTLTNALSFFETTYLDKKNEEAKQAGKKREHVHWKFRKQVRNVQTTDITNEVDKCSTKGAVSRYNNINHHNAEAVKDTINEEHRFKEMFTFHAATRFIDRLVSYDEESEDIDIQVPHALDVFERTLQRAIKQGVQMEEHDDIFQKTDEKGNVTGTEIQKGANIIIPTSCYDEEAKKIFGTFPLKLGICRSGKYDRNVVICTVFPKGIY